MRKKNYIHNVIRIRKGKSGLSQVYWLIVILNKKKTSSQKVVEQLGFFRYGKKRLFVINYQRLAYFLNKGYKIKRSIKHFIFWNTTLYIGKKIGKKTRKIKVKKKTKKTKKAISNNKFNNNYTNKNNKFNNNYTNKNNKFNNNYTNKNNKFNNNYTNKNNKFNNNYIKKN
jgi:ribosomal protein S16